MKKTQRTENPYKNTDTNKRYFTYDYYLRKKYGKKLARIPLDMGLTCPNIDGRCAYGGCIYCSSRGSGDFAESASLPLREQYDRARARLSSKWSTESCIAYFQAHTNTYATLDFLKRNFEDSLTFDGICAMSIATRADCLEPEICEYLADLAERIPLTVELGLQSSSDKTAEFIIKFCRYIPNHAGYDCSNQRTAASIRQRIYQTREKAHVKSTLFGGNLRIETVCYGNKVTPLPFPRRTLG